MKDPFRLEDVPSYDDLRRIEDKMPKYDNSEELGETGVSKLDAMRYSMEKAHWQENDILVKYDNPSDSPEIGVRLMKKDVPITVDMLPAYGSAFGAVAGGFIGGPFVAGLGALTGGVATEVGVRGLGYAWSKGRKRDDIAESRSSPYNEAMEEILEDYESELSDF